MLTVQEAAKEMRVSTRSIYRWLKAGKLPYVQIDRTIRIAREPFRALISGKK